MLRIISFVLILVISLVPAVIAGGSSEESSAETASEAEPAGKADGENEAEATEGAQEPTSGRTGLSTEESLALLADIGLQTASDPDRAQDFELPRLNSADSRTLSSYEGNIVLLNFWASWCPPCIEEMPSMQSLYDQLDGQSFEIVAVNLQEDPSTVEAFIEEHGFSFPVLLDRNGGTASQYGVRGIPTSYIIGKDGQVLARKVGFHEWDGEDTVAAFNRMSRPSD